MRMTWKQWIVVACLAGAAMPVVAQRSDTLVVDGNDWMSATQVERQAYLIGAANLIIAENANAKRRNLPPAPVSDRIAKAAENMKIGDIEARITQWYEANPARRSTPVMGVVWQDIVKPKQ